MRVKKAHQAVKVAARVATKMALETQGNANAHLGISPYVGRSPKNSIDASS
jgi:hypothetical protein